MSTYTAVVNTEGCLISGLRCPFCGDHNIDFHSRTTVAAREGIEWAGIFVCSESHIFFAPLTVVLRRDGKDEISYAGLKALRVMISERAASLSTTRQATQHNLERAQRLRKRISRTVKKLRNKRNRNTLLIQ